MSNKQLYESPISVIVEIKTEYILFASTGNEGVGEEEDNGGFN